jgi:hypothetical protein
VVKTYNDVIERQRLRNMIDLANRLGYHDDVAHWTAKLNETEEAK